MNENDDRDREEAPPENPGQPQSGDGEGQSEGSTWGEGHNGEGHGGEGHGGEEQGGEGQGGEDLSEELEQYGEGEEDEDEREQGVESVTIEITGLSLYTHHGVSSAEREIGQRLMLDLRLEVGETDATVTDRIEDTVDYGEVCQLVALIAQQRSHRTLERLCSTIADRLLADYELEGVWVKATKPEPPIPLPVAEVSVEVWREAEE
jgi:dihydroneopterin aldolase